MNAYIHTSLKYTNITLKCTKKDKIILFLCRGTPLSSDGSLIAWPLENTDLVSVSSEPLDEVRPLKSNRIESDTKGDISFDSC